VRATKGCWVQRGGDAGAPRFPGNGGLVPVANVGAAVGGGGAFRLGRLGRQEENTSGGMQVRDFPANCAAGPELDCQQVASVPDIDEPQMRGGLEDRTKRADQVPTREVAAKILLHSKVCPCVSALALRANVTAQAGWSTGATHQQQPGQIQSCPCVQGRDDGAPW